MSCWILYQALLLNNDNSGTYTDLDLLWLYITNILAILLVHLVIFWTTYKEHYLFNHAENTHKFKAQDIFMIVASLAILFLLAFLARDSFAVLIPTAPSYVVVLVFAGSFISQLLYKVKMQKEINVSARRAEALLLPTTLQIISFMGGFFIVSFFATQLGVDPNEPMPWGLIVALIIVLNILLETGVFIAQQAPHTLTGRIVRMLFYKLNIQL